MNQKLIALMMVSMLAVAAVTGCGSKNQVKTGDSQTSAAPDSTVETVRVGDDKSKEEEEVTVKPTFMYFVSDSDADLDKAKESYQALEKKYGDDVTFQLINIDENPEAAENFPVKDQTPMLIMMDTKNNISALLAKCSDETQLDETIQQAMQ